MVLRLKGELDWALADLNRAIAINPNDGGAYRQRGIVYEAKRDSARAQADYRVADKLELQSLTSAPPRQ
jgi:Flp pilus assembly protein TadD